MRSVLWILWFGCLSICANGAVAAQELERSIVRVIVSQANGFTSGTGFVVAHNGFVITNNHVFSNTKSKNDQEIRVFREGDLNRGFVAFIVWRSANQDLAILQAPGLPSPPVVINTGPLQKGDRITAVGYPISGDAVDRKADAFFVASRTIGNISRIIDADWRNSGRRVKIIQHTAVLKKGSSGGPLFNHCGEVIGVNTAFASDGPELIGKSGPVAPQPNQINASFFSSHAGELSRLLASVNIRATTVSTRCSPTETDPYLIFTVMAAAMTSLATIVFLSMRYRGKFAFSQLNKTVRSKTAKYHRPENSSRRTGADGAGYVLQPLNQTNAGDALQISLREAAAGQGILIGRDPGPRGQIINSNNVSRRHAVITCPAVTTGEIYIEDLSSRNGTRVNGRALEAGGSFKIMVGDQVIFADRAFVCLELSMASRAVNNRSGTLLLLKGRDPQTGEPIIIPLVKSGIARKGQLIVGRNANDCDYVISHRSISGPGHVKFFIHGNELVIADLNSTNGTRVNGIDLASSQHIAVKEGASIELGAVKLSVEQLTNFAS